jgi:hypothetical protein
MPHLGLLAREEYLTALVDVARIEGAGRGVEGVSTPSSQTTPRSATVPMTSPRSLTRT